MAVNPGQKISQADLQALADQANGLSSGFFDLTAFYDVTPMYWANGLTYDDGSGSQKYGHDTFASVILVLPGTGYTTGEYVFYNLQPGFVDHPYALKLRIERVDPTGGIMELRLVQSGISAPGTMSSGVKSLAHPVDFLGNPLTSDTGTGATVNVSVVQVGPTRGYNFPDFDLNKVDCWNFFLANGGTGYAVGNTLGVPEMPGLVLTVATVSGGTILTFTITTGTTAKSIPLDVAAMATAAITGTGTGATVGGWPTMLQNPGLQSELNRLRANLTAIQLLGGGSQASVLSPALLEGISGPWPVAGPTNNFSDTWFWYANSGGTESVTLVSIFYPFSMGSFRTAVYGNAVTNIYTGAGWWPVAGGGIAGPYDATADPGYTIGQTIADGSGYYFEVLGKFDNGSGYWIEYDLRPVRTDVSSVAGLLTTHNEYSIVIGGEDILNLTGVFYIQAAIVPGSTIVYTNGILTSTTPDSTDAASQIAISGNFPGAAAVQTVPASGSSGTYLLITFTVNQPIAPGKYTAKIDITPPADDTDITTTNKADDNYQDGSSYPYVAGYPFAGTSSFQRTVTTFTRANLLYAPSSSAQPVMSGAASVTFSGGIPSFSGNAQASITYNMGVAAAGIHNSLQIYKIKLPGDYMGVGAGIGTVIQMVMPTPDFMHMPYPQPVFSPERIAINFVSITPSTTGFWTAFSNMVGSLNPALNSQMPWNVLLTRYGAGGGASASYNRMLLGDLAPNVTVGSVVTANLSNSYDQTKPVEGQQEPPTWIASRYFSVGFRILDSNGNFQEVTVSGVTNTTHPAWATTVGGTVTDGTVTWQCEIVNTAPRRIAPAVHRLPNFVNGENGLPRYPFYWYSETIAKMKPPVSTGGLLTIWGGYEQWTIANSTGTGWQKPSPNGQAYGWFIYSVSISRNKLVIKASPAPVGAGSASVGAGATDTSAGATAVTGEVAVTIGCIRNGSFVFFGIWASGQTIQVLWPVFTTDALVYQCSERVDIQALAIANGGAGVSFGAGVTFPAVSAYVTDTQKLLTLIAAN